MSDCAPSVGFWAQGKGGAVSTSPVKPELCFAWATARKPQGRGKGWSHLPSLDPWMADWRCQGLRCWGAELTATSALLRGCAPALWMGMAWQESVGAGHLPILVSVCKTRVLITERPLQSAGAGHVKGCETWVEQAVNQLETEHHAFGAGLE